MSLFREEIIVMISQKRKKRFAYEVLPVKRLTFSGYRKAKRETLEFLGSSETKYDSADFYTKDNRWLKGVYF